MEKKYRLWTFQSIGAITELKSKAILEVSWDLYPPTDPFVKTYHWMVKELAARKINCNNYAPIWAWHSCEKYEKAPTLTDARALLDDRQLQDGIQTIEFECPVELVLLSSYDIWNTIMDNFCYCNDEIKIDKKTEARLFKVHGKKLRKYDSIQATLPYLKLDWVKEIRKLNLQPEDSNCNWGEEV